MVTMRGLPLIAFALLSGCLSAPPSGVITCNNNCPISGYYCAGDGYCWANGEYPNLTSGTSAGTASSGGTAGLTSGGSTSAGTGSTGTTGKAATATTGGSSTGHPTTGGSSSGGKSSTTGR